MVICLERDADLHMVQLMPLPLTVSCFSKTLIGFTFLAPAHPGSPGQRAVKRVCVCVCVLCSKLVQHQRHSALFVFLSRSHYFPAPAAFLSHITRLPNCIVINTLRVLAYTSYPPQVLRLSPNRTNSPKSVRLYLITNDVSFQTNSKYTDILQSRTPQFSLSVRM